MNKQKLSANSLLQTNNLLCNTSVKQQQTIQALTAYFHCKLNHFELNYYILTAHQRTHIRVINGVTEKTITDERKR